MADKSVGELIAATSVTPTDLFVLEQNGTAKKLTGQVLENWLVSFADGHGGIQSSELLKTVGLVKTYRFTLADQTYIDIDVVDGRGIESVKPTSTVGLVVTYTVTYNDGTTSTFNVTNGAKGDKGDRADVWVKYASQKPTASSHSFGDVPDSWIGIATGHNMDTAPTDWKQYTWFQWKGEKGDTGDPATLVSSQVTYQVGDSGTIIPSVSWSSSVPVVAQGKYLWTRTINTFNTGDPVISYSVSRMGLDGSGSVVSVANIPPDENGNVPLTAEYVGALPSAGGDMTGAINMNGQSISGLNDPTEDTQAASKGYVDSAKAEANAYTDASVRKAAPRNLLDNSDFSNPVNQRGQTSYTNGYTIDRWFNQSNGSVSIGDGYLTFTPKDDNANQVWFEQKTEKCEYLLGKRITLAVEYADGHTEIGNATVSHDEFSYKDITGISLAFGLIGNGLLRTVLVFRGDSVDLRSIALYEGEYTIDTLPEYQPKGYGAELLECQRYYYYFDIDTNGIYFPCVQGITQIPGFLFPVTMRVNPTVNMKTFGTWTTAGLTDIIGSISSYMVGKGGLKYIELTSVLPAHGLIYLAAEFSADL